MSDTQQVAPPDAESNAKASIGDILTTLMALGGEDSEDEDEDDDDDEYGSELDGDKSESDGDEGYEEGPGLGALLQEDQLDDDEDDEDEYKPAEKKIELPSAHAPEKLTPSSEKDAVESNSDKVVESNSNSDQEDGEGEGEGDEGAHPAKRRKISSE